MFYLSWTFFRFFAFKESASILAIRPCPCFLDFTFRVTGGTSIRAGLVRFSLFGNIGRYLLSAVAEFRHPLLVGSNPFLRPLQRQWEDQISLRGCAARFHVSVHITKGFFSSLPCNVEIYGLSQQVHGFDAGTAFHL